MFTSRAVLKKRGKCVRFTLGRRVQTQPRWLVLPLPFLSLLLFLFLFLLREVGKSERKGEEKGGSVENKVQGQKVRREGTGCWLDLAPTRSKTGSCLPPRLL